MESSENGPTGNNCRCGNPFKPQSNPCLTNIGNNYIVCAGQNSYIQCNSAQCTPVLCLPGQVWTAATPTTAAGCAACPPGRHISLDGTRCVCNFNTTSSTLTGPCTACPGGALVTNDLCFCNRQTTRLDKVNNACRACPTGSVLSGESSCTCLGSLFFDPSTWTCKACPGTLVQVNRNGRQQCRCTGLNQILNGANLSCYTCPAGTLPDRDNDECLCTGQINKKFDMVSQQCVCTSGTQLNAATGICQRLPVVVPVSSVSQP
jgi:hypothetical protein